MCCCFRSCWCARFARPLLALLIAVTAFATYYMQRFGVYLDPTMLRNVFGTDPAEASELFGWGMLPHLLVFGVLPLLLLWRVRLVRQPLGRALLLRLATMAGAALVLIAAMLPVFQDFSALMRNHKAMRYLITPGNLIYSTGTCARRRRGRGGATRPHARSARTRGSTPHGPARTQARAAGAGRRRNGAGGQLGVERLQRARPRPNWRLATVINFPDVKACGTNTETSLPCMFAAVGRRDYDERRIRTSESLLHVLNRAGFQVLWRDNQSGCKGVCDGLPRRNGLTTSSACRCATAAAAWTRRCWKGSTPWRAMRRATWSWCCTCWATTGRRTTSATPRPSAASPRPATPASCTSARASRSSTPTTTRCCTPTMCWPRPIGFLQAQSERFDSALVYVSDHGESLGEKGLFLHGVPYAIAPDEQTKVPMTWWLSPGYSASFGLDTACLRREAARRARTTTCSIPCSACCRCSAKEYDNALDITRPCRR